MDVNSYDFRELFRVDPSTLPQIEKLLRNSVGLHGEASAIEGDLRETASQGLESIAKVFEFHGLQPLIIEMALVANQRLLKRNETPFFVSYATSWLARGDEVLTWYSESLKFMKKEPMVPHLPLYEKALWIGEPLETSERPTGEPVLLGHGASKSIYGLRYEFRTDRESTSKPEKLISRWRELFLTSDQLTDVDLAALRRSTFIVVPIRRPHHRSPLTSGQEDDLVHPSATPTPAGAIFAFASPRTGVMNRDSVVRLGRGLVSVLALASLRESYSAMDAAASQRDMLRSMTHSAVTTIRSGKAEELANQLFGKESPGPTDHLLLEDLHRNENKIRKALQDLRLGNDTATALITFMEMSVSGEVLRKKFLGNEARALKDIIDEAVSIVDGSAFGAARFYPIDSSVSGVDVTLPEGYLDPSLLRGVLCEFLKNASQHGAPDPHTQKVPVSIKISLMHPDVVLCKVINTAKTESYGELRGNLQRLCKTFDRIDGVEIKLEQGAEFEAWMVLGPIRVEGKSTECDSVTSPIID